MPAVVAQVVQVATSTRICGRDPVSHIAAGGSRSFPFPDLPNGCSAHEECDMAQTHEHDVRDYLVLVLRGLVGSSVAPTYLPLTSYRNH